jgi:hypothetical protein
MFQEHKRAEVSDLAWLAAHTLHALSVCRFRRIDHWELTPGGWLPPPEFSSRDPNGAEPVGQLLNALEGETTSTFAGARSFSVRASDLHGNRIDVVIRRVVRFRRHALSIDLWGRWTKAAVQEIAGALAARLPVLSTTLTKHMYYQDGRK